MTWTHFWDMNSGGGTKETWQHIFIEAPEAEARVVFYNRFGHNPERVSCTCCGEDYSISEDETLEQATGYHYGRHLTVAEFVAQDDVLVIRADEIDANERTGDVPEQGYVWAG